MNIEINNRTVAAKPGEVVLDVLHREGINVPTLCNLDCMTPTGACRMCVVEVEGMHNLPPSCALPVYDGMRVQTHSARAVQARKTIVELLLASHPDDCLYCHRNGNCELQTLSRELGVRERDLRGTREHHKLDVSSSALVRDPEKCILCGRCVRVCEEVQHVGAIDFIGRGSKSIVGTAFDQGLNVSSCINCGQCVVVCPTGALREQSQVKRVTAALQDPEKIVVVQHAPAISVTLAEEFGAGAGTDIDGVMTAALRRLGFQYVFETSFSADLTIMEEASELAQRIKNGGKLPMMTSCSPGWIKYVEQYYPDMLANLSTCKSPQQMMGALIKTFFAQKTGIDPEKIFSVSIMPCTAKKFEANRPEMGEHGNADIDAVLTTRELAALIRQYGIDLNALKPETPDNPFGERSSAGKLFAASGGVMEAAVRTAHFLLTGEELEELKMTPLRGQKGIKEAKLRINGSEVGVAVVSGLNNACELLEELRQGRSDLHFIEVMTCPSGCVSGGGQPLGIDEKAVRARMQALYRIDRDSAVRVSHKNESIKRLYDEFLGEPLGEKSHHLLHTTYAEREVVH